ncbi:hypothetical protein [Gemmata obscuriglobus]|nr:hypothetical protein [Gemmata obscuriglobus]
MGEESAKSPNVFVLIGLPWFMVHGDPPRLFTVDLVADGSRAGRMLPLFSDSDLAERFAQDHIGTVPGLAGFRPYTRHEATYYLRRARENGTQHVCIDPAPHGQLPRPIPRDIDHVIAAFESAQQ